MMKKTRYIKTIAVFTLSCFLLSSVLGQSLYALVLNARENGSYERLMGDCVIPYTAGRITEARCFGSPRVIVAIQDLHCHGETQKNISRILAALEEKYGVSRVCVEGGIGELDTSWLAGIRNEELKRSIADALVEQGKLSGPEYYSVTANKPRMLTGLEDERLYAENLGRLNGILAGRAECGRLISGLRADLDVLKDRYYASGNRKLDRLAARHAQGKIDGIKYYEALRNHARRLGIDAGRYTNFTAYLELAKLGRELKYRKLAKELQGFVALLKQKLPYAVFGRLMERTGNFSKLDELYVYLSGISAESGLRAALERDYPHLKDFLSYVDKSRKINPLSLITEEKCLLRELRAALSQNLSERETAFIADLFDCQEDYLHNKLTAQNYAYYLENREAFALLWKKYTDTDRSPALAPHLALMDEFYGANVARNNCFLKNIFCGEDCPPAGEQNEAVRSDPGAAPALLSGAEDVTVVVSGGFHTSGLAELFAERRISYVVVTPNVTQDNTAAERAYDMLAKQWNDVLSQTMDMFKASNAACPAYVQASDMAGAALKQFFDKGLTDKEIETLFNETIFEPLRKQGRTAVFAGSRSADGTYRFTIECGTENDRETKEYVYAGGVIASTGKGGRSTAGLRAGNGALDAQRGILTLAGRKSGLSSLVERCCGLPAPSAAFGRNDDGGHPVLAYVRQSLAESYAELADRLEKKVSVRATDAGLLLTYKKHILARRKTLKIPSAMSAEEAYFKVRYFLAHPYPVRLKEDVHFNTHFHKPTIRKKVFDKLFDIKTKKGLLLDMVRRKAASGDRTLRMWSCGAATGKELRTMVWLATLALEAAGEKPVDWKLAVVATDEIKQVLDIAMSFTGPDTRFNDETGENEPVTVDLRGVDVRYVMANHTRLSDVRHLAAWQEREGGFDWVMQIATPWDSESSAVLETAINDGAFFAHHDNLYVKRGDVFEEYGKDEGAEVAESSVPETGNPPGYTGSVYGTFDWKPLADAAFAACGKTCPAAVPAVLSYKAAQSILKKLGFYPVSSYDDRIDEALGAFRLQGLARVEVYGGPLSSIPGWNKAAEFVTFVHDPATGLHIYIHEDFLKQWAGRRLFKSPIYLAIAHEYLASEGKGRTHEDIEKLGFGLKWLQAQAGMGLGDDEIVRSIMQNWLCVPVEESPGNGRPECPDAHPAQGTKPVLQQIPAFANYLVELMHRFYAHYRDTSQNARVIEAAEKFGVGSAQMLTGMFTQADRSRNVTADYLEEVRELLQGSAELLKRLGVSDIEVWDSPYLAPTRDIYAFAFIDGAGTPGKRKIVVSRMLVESLKNRELAASARSELEALRPGAKPAAESSGADKSIVFAGIVRGLAEEWATLGVTDPADERYRPDFADFLRRRGLARDPESYRLYLRFLANNLSSAVIAYALHRGIPSEIDKEERFFERAKSLPLSEVNDKVLHPVYREFYRSLSDWNVIDKWAGSGRMPVPVVEALAAQRKTLVNEVTAALEQAALSRFAGEIVLLDKAQALPVDEIGEESVRPEYLAFFRELPDWNILRTWVNRKLLSDDLVLCLDRQRKAVVDTFVKQAFRECGYQYKPGMISAVGSRNPVTSDYDITVEHPRNERILRQFFDIWEGRMPRSHEACLDTHVYAQPELLDISKFGREVKEEIKKNETMWSYYAFYSQVMFKSVNDTSRMDEKFELWEKFKAIELKAARDRSDVVGFDEYTIVKSLLEDAEKRFDEYMDRFLGIRRKAFPQYDEMLPEIRAGIDARVKKDMYGEKLEEIDAFKTAVGYESEQEITDPAVIAKLRNLKMELLSLQDDSYITASAIQDIVYNNQTAGENTAHPRYRSLVKDGRLHYSFNEQMAKCLSRQDRRDVKELLGFSKYAIRLLDILSTYNLNTHENIELYYHFVSFKGLRNKSDEEIEFYFQNDVRYFIRQKYPELYYDGMTKEQMALIVLDLINSRLDEYHYFIAKNNIISEPDSVTEVSECVKAIKTKSGLKIIESDDEISRHNDENHATVESEDGVTYEVDTEIYTQFLSNLAVVRILDTYPREARGTTVKIIGVNKANVIDTHRKTDKYYAFNSVSVRWEIIKTLPGKNFTDLRAALKNVAFKIFLLGRLRDKGNAGNYLEEIRGDIAPLLRLKEEADERRNADVDIWIIYNLLVRIIDKIGLAEQQELITVLRSEIEKEEKRIGPAGTAAQALGVSVMSVVRGTIGVSAVTGALGISFEIGRSITARLPHARAPLPDTERAVYREREQKLSAQTGVRIATCKGDGPKGSMFIAADTYGFACQDPEKREYLVSEGFWEVFKTDAERGAVIRHEQNELRYLAAVPGSGMEDYHAFVKARARADEAYRQEAAVIEKAEALLIPAIRNARFRVGSLLAGLLKPVVPSAVLGEGAVTTPARLAELIASTKLMRSRITSAEELPLSRTVQKPDRKSPRAEEKAVIELEKTLMLAMFRLRLLALDARSEKDPVRKAALEREEKDLFESLRTLYGNISAGIEENRSFEYYQAELRRLRQERKGIERELDKAYTGGREAYKNLAARYIDLNRRIMKTQVKVALMFAEEDNLNPHVRHLNAPLRRNAALWTIKGAIFSARHMADEMRPWMNATGTGETIREYAATDWLGNAVAAPGIAGIDVEIRPVEGEKIPVSVRQQKWINVHARLRAAVSLVRKGRISEAGKEYQTLIGLYDTKELPLLETYTSIRADLQALRDELDGLPDSQAPPRDFVKALSERTKLLIPRIAHPRQKVWMDVGYSGLAESLRSKFDTIAGYRAEIPELFGHIINLEYFKDTLQEAHQEKKLSARVKANVLSGLAEIAGVMERGFVYPKQIAYEDVLAAITMLERNEYAKAWESIGDAVKQLNARLEEIRRIESNVERQAYAIYGEYRDRDIEGRIESIVRLIKEREYDNARGVLDELMEAYFGRELFEPGYKRAGRLLAYAQGLLVRHQRVLRTEEDREKLILALDVAKRDVENKNSFRVTVVAADGSRQFFFTEPGTTVQDFVRKIGKETGLLNAVLAERADWVQQLMGDPTRMPDSTTISLTRAMITNRESDGSGRKNILDTLSSAGKTLSVLFMIGYGIVTTFQLLSGLHIPGVSEALQSVLANLLPGAAGAGGAALAMGMIGIPGGRRGSMREASLSLEAYFSDIEEAEKKGLIVSSPLFAPSPESPYEHFNYKGRLSDDVEARLSDKNTRSLDANAELLLKHLFAAPGKRALRILETGAGAGFACSQISVLAERMKREIVLESNGFTPFAPHLRLKADYTAILGFMRRYVQAYYDEPILQFDTTMLTLGGLFTLQKNGYTVFERTPEPFVSRQYVDQFANLRLLTESKYDFINDFYGGFFYTVGLDNAKRALDTLSYLLADNGIFYTAKLSTEELGAIGNANVSDDLLLISGLDQKNLIVLKKGSEYARRAEGALKNAFVSPNGLRICDDFDTLLSDLFLGDDKPAGMPAMPNSMQDAFFGVARNAVAGNSEVVSFARSEASDVGSARPAGSALMSAPTLMQYVVRQYGANVWKNWNTLTETMRAGIRRAAAVRYAPFAEKDEINEALKSDAALQAFLARHPAGSYKGKLREGVRMIGAVMDAVERQFSSVNDTGLIAAFIADYFIANGLSGGLSRGQLIVELAGIARLAISRAPPAGVTVTNVRDLANITAHAAWNITQEPEAFLTTDEGALASAREFLKGKRPGVFERIKERYWTALWLLAKKTGGYRELFKLLEKSRADAVVAVNAVVENYGANLENTRLPDEIAKLKRGLGPMERAFEGFVEGIIADDLATYGRADIELSRTESEAFTNGFYALRKIRRCRSIRKAAPIKDRGTAVYIASGGDVSLPVLLGGAQRIFLFDLHPFKPSRAVGGKTILDMRYEETEALPPYKLADYKRAYYANKRVANFVNWRTFRIDIGMENYFRWELEALGAYDISVSLDKGFGCFRMDFTVPGESFRRSLYYICGDATKAATYPEAFTRLIRDNGVDGVIVKAPMSEQSVDFPAPVKKHLIKGLRKNNGTVYADLLWHGSLKPVQSATYNGARYGLIEAYRFPRRNEVLVTESTLARYVSETYGANVWKNWNSLAETIRTSIRLETALLYAPFAEKAMIDAARESDEALEGFLALHPEGSDKAKLREGVRFIDSVIKAASARFSSVSDTAKIAAFIADLMVEQGVSAAVERDVLVSMLRGIAVLAVSRAPPAGITVTGVRDLANILAHAAWNITHGDESRLDTADRFFPSTADELLFSTEKLTLSEALEKTDGEPEWVFSGTFDSVKNFENKGRGELFVWDVFFELRKTVSELFRNSFQAANGHELVGANPVTVEAAYFPGMARIRFRQPVSADSDWGKLKNNHALFEKKASLAVSGRTSDETLKTHFGVGLEKIGELLQSADKPGLVRYLRSSAAPNELVTELYVKSVAVKTKELYAPVRYAPYSRAGNAAARALVPAVFAMLGFGAFFIAPLLGVVPVFAGTAAWAVLSVQLAAARSAEDLAPDTAAGDVEESGLDAKGKAIAAGLVAGLKAKGARRVIFTDSLPEGTVARTNYRERTVQVARWIVAASDDAEFNRRRSQLLPIILAHEGLRLTPVVRFVPYVAKLFLPVTYARRSEQPSVEPRSQYSASLLQDAAKVQEKTYWFLFWTWSRYLSEPELYARLQEVRSLRVRDRRNSLDMLVAGSIVPGAGYERNLEEFRERLPSRERGMIEDMIREGIAYDLRFYGEDWTEVEKTIVRKGFMSCEDLAHYRKLRGVGQNADELNALYAASGSDMTVPALLSTARNIFMFDKRPYEGREIDAETTAFNKSVYYAAKSFQDFMYKEIYDTGHGMKRYILWELEAMGAENVRAAFDETFACPRIDFMLPGEQERRSVYYFEKDIVEPATYGGEFGEFMRQNGIDVFIQKASMGVELPSAVKDTIVSCLRKPLGRVYTDTPQVWHEKLFKRASRSVFYGIISSVWTVTDGGAVVELAPAVRDERTVLDYKVIGDFDALMERLGITEERLEKDRLLAVYQALLKSLFDVSKRSIMASETIGGDDYTIVTVPGIADSGMFSESLELYFINGNFVGHGSSVFAAEKKDIRIRMGKHEEVRSSSSQIRNLFSLRLGLLRQIAGKENGDRCFAAESFTVPNPRDNFRENGLPQVTSFEALMFYLRKGFLPAREPARQIAANLMQDAKDADGGIRPGWRVDPQRLGDFHKACGDLVLDLKAERAAGSAAGAVAGPVSEVLKAAANPAEGVSGKGLLETIMSRYANGRHSSPAGKNVYFIGSDEASLTESAGPLNRSGLRSICIMPFAAGSRLENKQKIGRIVVRMPDSGPELVQVWAGMSEGLQAGERTAVLYLKPLGHPELAAHEAPAGTLSGEQVARMVFLGLGAREAIRQLNGDPYMQKRLGLGREGFAPDIIVMNDAAAFLANPLTVTGGAERDLLFSRTAYFSRASGVGDNAQIPAGTAGIDASALSPAADAQGWVKLSRLAGLADGVLEEGMDAERVMREFASAVRIKDAQAVMKGCDIEARIDMDNTSLSDSGMLSLTDLRQLAGKARDAGIDRISLESLFEEKGQSEVRKEAVNWARVLETHRELREEDVFAQDGSVRIADVRRYAYPQLAELLAYLHGKGLQLKAGRSFTVSDGRQETLDAAQRDIVFWLSRGIEGQRFDDARLDASRAADLTAERFGPWLKALRKAVPADSRLSVLLPRGLEREAAGLCADLRVRIVREVDINNDAPGSVSAGENIVLEMRSHRDPLAMSQEELEAQARRLETHIQQCPAAESVSTPADILLNGKVLVASTARTLVALLRSLRPEAPYGRGFSLALGLDDSDLPEAGTPARVSRIPLPDGSVCEAAGPHAVLDAYRSLESGSRQRGGAGAWAEFFAGDGARTAFFNAVRSAVTGVQDGSPVSAQIAACERRISNGSPAAAADAGREVAGFVKGLLARSLEKRYGTGALAFAGPEQKATFLSFLVYADSLRSRFNNDGKAFLNDADQLIALLSMSLRLNDERTVRDLISGYCAAGRTAAAPETTLRVMEGISVYVNALENRSRREAAGYVRSILPQVREMAAPRLEDGEENGSASTTILAVNALACLRHCEELAGDAASAAVTAQRLQQIAGRISGADIADNDLILALSLSNAGELVPSIAGPARLKALENVRAQLAARPDLVRAYHAALPNVVPTQALIQQELDGTARTFASLLADMREGRALPRPRTAEGLFMIFDHLEPETKELVDDDMKKSVLNTFQTAGILSSL